MAFITVLSRDSGLQTLVAGAGEPTSVAGTRSWERLIRLVRERPVTHVVLDSAALPSGWGADVLLGDLVRRFPSVGTVFVARPGLSPVTLLHLGRAGIEGLTLLPLDDPSVDLPRCLARASARTTSSLVLREVGGRISTRDAGVLRAALDAALLGWSTDDLAGFAGWTRPHLSALLRASGLPSAGRLLRWAKVLHAARWLPEPGRTAESVSRQLEYANGSTFRRALRGCLGSTPTEVVAAGGFRFALDRFLDVLSVGDSLRGDRSVA
jgi:AraC-like DNA-binding protein